LTFIIKFTIMPTSRSDADTKTAAPASDAPTASQDGKPPSTTFISMAAPPVSTAVGAGQESKADWIDVNSQTRILRLN
jgi:hypothetical protein